MSRARGRGNAVLEFALWFPVLLLLVVGMIEFGRIEYLQYSLRKALYTVGRTLSVQQGLDLCDADVMAAMVRNLIVDPNTQQPLVSNLTADMIQVSTVCLDASGNPAAVRYQRLHRHSRDAAATRIPDGFHPRRLPGPTAHSVHPVEPHAAVPYRDGSIHRERFVKRRKAKSGQATAEFALLYAAAILPLTFMIVFVAEMLWIWHSAADFTREGARYAATSCWASDGSAEQRAGAHATVSSPM